MAAKTFYLLATAGTLLGHVPGDGVGKHDHGV
jgi:hypothetical protein